MPAARPSSRFLFSLFCLAVFCSLPALAVDQTVAGKVGEPLEISLSASDALTEWMAKDYPSSLVEQAAVRRLPAETVFVFRPLTIGRGVIRFVKKVSGGAGARVVTHDVEILITGTPSLEPAGAPPPTERMGDTGAVVSPATQDQNSIWNDAIFLKMLGGTLGFPAKNKEPARGPDTDAQQRKFYPLPYALTYYFPEGSYLLNPTHHLPLPDTPPGLDTAPPAYHQALALAKRGLYGEASKVLDEMIKDMAAKKKTMPKVVLAFYEFVNAHILMEQGSYDEARQRFKKLFDDLHFGVASRFYAAYATEKMGDTIGAITGYQGVISHNPEGFFTPEAAWRISKIFYKARAYDRAMQEYKNYIQHYPQTAFIDDAIFDLASIYDQIYVHQDFDLALKLYDTILKNYDASPYKDTVTARKKFVLENFF